MCLLFQSLIRKYPGLADNDAFSHLKEDLNAKKLLIESVTVMIQFPWFSWSLFSKF